MSNVLQDIEKQIEELLAQFSKNNEDITELSRQRASLQQAIEQLQYGQLELRGKIEGLNVAAEALRNAPPEKRNRGTKPAQGE